MHPIDRETLSRMMDGEWQDLDPSHCVEGVCQDPSLRAVWARYHLVRDVIRQEPVSVSGVDDFVSRVSNALTEEPTYSNVATLPGAQRAVHASMAAIEIPPATVESVAPMRQARDRRHWHTGLAGLGVAASVAVVTVVGLNLWQQQINPAALDVRVADAGAGDVRVLSSTGAIDAPIVPGVVLPQVDLVSNGGSYWVSNSERRDAEAERRLNAFLSQHIENSPTADHQGMLPYSRLVGYDQAAPE